MKEDSHYKKAYTGKQKRILLQLISYAMDRKLKGLDKELLGFSSFKEDVTLEELEVLAGKITREG